MSAWDLHLENVALRAKIAALKADLRRERVRTEVWRIRALRGRSLGRATSKTTKTVRK